MCRFSKPLSVPPRQRPPETQLNKVGFSAVAMRATEKQLGRTWGGLQAAVRSSGKGSREWSFTLGWMHPEAGVTV